MSVFLDICDEDKFIRHTTDIAKKFSEEAGWDCVVHSHALSEAYHQWMNLGYPIILNSYRPKKRVVILTAVLIVALSNNDWVEVTQRGDVPFAGVTKFSCREFYSLIVGLVAHDIGIVEVERPRNSLTVHNNLIARDDAKTLVFEAVDALQQNKKRSVKFRILLKLIATYTARIVIH